MISAPTGIKSKYLVGGEWKAYTIKRRGKRSATNSTPARIYLAKPPAEGWPGGMPEQNGWKPKAGR